MAAIKISVSLDETIVKALDVRARAYRNRNRSAVVSDACESFLRKETNQVRRAPRRLSTST